MDDLISRQDAIDAICHHGEIENDYTDIYHDGYCDGIYDAVDTIKALPSAERKGHWNTIQGNIIICSICGMGAPQVMTGCLMNRHLEPNRTNFCPNCGASMVRGEEDGM